MTDGMVLYLHALIDIHKAHLDSNDDEVNRVSDSVEQVAWDLTGDEVHLSKLFCMFLDETFGNRFDGAESIKANE